MRDLLRFNLKRALGELTDEDRLHAAWPLACGSALASRAEVLYLDAEGLLHIRIPDRAWRECFFEMRSTLRDDLARIAGVRLAGIHFDEPRPSRPTASRRPAHKPVSPRPSRRRPSP